MGWLLRFHGSEALLSQSEYVDGGVGIAVYGKPAHRTQVPTVIQLLFGTAFPPVRAVAAPRTILTCVGRVDGNYLTPSAFSLRRENQAELRPGGVCNRLGKAVIAEHSLDTEFFDGNDSEAVDDAPRILMAEVMATVSDALMDARNDLSGLPAFCIAEL